MKRINLWLSNFLEYPSIGFSGILSFYITCPVRNLAKNTVPLGLFNYLYLCYSVA